MPEVGLTSLQLDLLRLRDMARAVGIGEEAEDLEAFRKELIDWLTALAAPVNL